MASSEKRFQTRVIKLLKEHSYYAMNINPDGITITAGTPDVIASIEGVFCGLELKIGKKYKATNRQLINLKQIRVSGGVGIVLIETDTWKEDLLEIIHLCTHKRIKEINDKYPLPEIQ